MDEGEWLPAGPDEQASSSTGEGCDAHAGGPAALVVARASLCVIGWLMRLCEQPFTIKDGAASRLDAMPFSEAAGGARSFFPFHCLPCEKPCPPG